MVALDGLMEWLVGNELDYQIVDNYVDIVDKYVDKV